MRRLFNDGWSFQKTKTECTLEEAVKGGGWERVDIPHDWLIYQTKELYETGTGWYRKNFVVGDAAKTRILRFEGVYMDTTVYVNGAKAGEWKYGYSTFEIEMTGLLREGENELVVRVDHRAPNSRWYSGAGIYRNCYLLEHEGAYLKSDSVYFHAEHALPGGEHWDIRLTCEAAAGVQSAAGARKAESETSETVRAACGEAGTAPNACGALSVRYTASDGAGKILFSVEGKPDEETRVSVEDPALWDVENPQLYTLETVLFCGGRKADVQRCRIGFRTIAFLPDSGFWLNGKRVKIKGVCLHHDLGALGAAVNRTALRRQLLSMKEMGANAVRTSHNMPAVEFMELCDELGILVDSEAFDMWELPKTPYDYARFFPEHCSKDVASWVRRDRNHPSVIMWSIGNEIYDTHVSERGEEVTKALCAEVKKHDAWHNACTTIGSNYIAWEGAQRCARHIELVGYNYGERLYEEHHERFPEWCIYGSETAARVQSRGIYHFPKSAAYITHDDLQCSSLENCRAGVSERTAQTSIIADRDTPFCAGQFIWTGSDYIGEPSPYATKNSYYGQIDTAGFRKDSYYLYQAAWTDKPVLHILPYWDFNDGQLIDVMVYTNQPWAELFLNGESLGKKSIGTGYSADWQVPYEKGVLRAAAYDENGAVTAEDETVSFSDTARLCLTPDKERMRADGEDLIFLTISAQDADGVFVANAKNRVDVAVSGAGRLVGLDSGDSTDYDEYKGTSKRLFSGKLLAIIAGKREGGEIFVRVTSPGLPDAERTLFAEQAAMPAGAGDAFTENRADAGTENMPNAGTKKQSGDGTEAERTADIPIRKIELTAHRRSFDAAHMETVVEAVVYPPEAIYGIEWAAVTQTGVETNIAKVTALEADCAAQADDAVQADCTDTPDGERCGRKRAEGCVGNNAVQADCTDMPDGERCGRKPAEGCAGDDAVQAKGAGCGGRALVRVCGDGTFRLRCYSRNGKPAPDVISELEMTVTGLGSAVIDPYGALVKGSLYNMSVETLDEVSEGGVKAGEGRRRVVGFRNVSFGRAGSDRFLIQVIHWHSNAPFSFSLWSGMPDADGSEKLGDFTYQADFVWQTYLPNSYRLTRKLTGTKELCFVFEATEQRVYFGGFQFEGVEEAYAEIDACEYSGLRGDQYTVEERAVRHIGNNVFLEFDGLDFVRGAASVTIKGDTRHAHDSVHMRVVGEWGEQKEILEFSHSGEDTEHTFPIKVPAGRADVKFDFLPGCDFDLVSFRFEA
ncbi:MAG: DUF4982 domain-containing protein [bacterium]|nr:DUF4982 domain-containing protein [bacterium]